MNGELFLQYLITHKLLTLEQKKECLRLWESHKTPLARLLVEQRYLTPEQLRASVQEFQKSTIAPSLEGQITQEAMTKPFQVGEAQSLLSEVGSFAKSTKKIRIQPETEAQETETVPFMAHQESLSDSAQQRVNSAIETTPIPERYQVIETLGQGGMGVVQRVQDNILGREVALKKLNLGIFGANLSSPKQKMLLWRLHREAEITAILEHPNIVPLYDMQKNAQGELYFTMRKVEGETLSSILRRKRKEADEEYDEPRLLSIFFKVCDAVAYAHSRKIIHRDLKPDNIMVGRFGEVYVMDWGIAKKLEESEVPVDGIFPKISTKLLPAGDFKTIGGIGTPGYMPPEQSESANSVTPQSDIFALGVILRQLYTLLSPMEEFHLAKKEIGEPKTNVLKNAPRFKMVPSEVQAIVEKATEEQVSKRYRSVTAMEADIQRYLNHGKVLAKDYHFFEIWWKWTRRNWKFLAGGISLLVIGVFFWFYSAWVQSETLQKQIQEKQTTVQSLRKQANQAQEWFRYVQKSDTEESKQGLSEQIQHLLKASNYLTLALNILPNAEVEAEKIKLNLQIIDLACKIEDYPLADYLASELDSLKGVSTQTKKEIQEKVKLEKNSKLKAHQSRLQYWIERLQKEQVTEAVQYNAIFEMSKMQEKEIFEKLLQILEQGTRYFLGEAEAPSLPLNGYYKTMAMALGRLENPKAVEPLLRALDILSKRYSKEVESSLTAVVDYMEQISYALIHSKAKNISKRFYAIRRETGINKWFWKRTRDIYQEMLILENEQSEEEPVVSSQENLDRFPGMKVKTLLEKAQLADKRGDFEEAVKLFSEVLQLFPHPEVFYERGRSRSSLRDFTGALSDYNAAIQRSPRAEYYKDRARVRTALNQLEGALSDYNEVLRLDSKKYSRVYAERGNIKLMRGDVSGALEDIQEGIRLDPQRFENYRILSQFYRTQNDLNNERKALEMMIRLGPKEPEGHGWLGMFYSRSGELLLALESLNEALKIEPKYVEALTARGETKLKMNDIEGAILDLKEAQRLNPKNPLSYYVLGNVALSQKKTEEALDYWEKGLTLYQDPIIVDSMAEVVMVQAIGLVREKSYREALTSLSRVKPWISEKHKHYPRFQEMLQELEKRQR